VTHLKSQVTHHGSQPKVVTHAIRPMVARCFVTHGKVWW
jgi:hypothetical protein